MRRSPYSNKNSSECKTLIKTDTCSVTRRNQARQKQARETHACANSQTNVLGPPGESKYVGNSTLLIQISLSPGQRREQNNKGQRHQHADKLATFSAISVLY